NNIVSTDGSEWKRHRKISAPQFSERNNALVYVETIRPVKSMFEYWERTSERDENGRMVVEIAKPMTALALMVISAVAFGVKNEWGETVNSEGFTGDHTMSFQESLDIVTSKLPLWLVLPRFVFKLPFWGLQRIARGMKEFEDYVKETIEKARRPSSEEGNLLQMLVKAATEDEEMVPKEN
ncbi:hypothetical protein HDU76_005339, partial [Blyttiomyces sp. JEL0837]